MRVLHKETNTLQFASISVIESEDWKHIGDSKEFDFDWTKMRSFDISKICLENNGVILGLIAIEDIPREYRLHIHLIENAKANRGQDKVFDYVAACLIANTCELAFQKEYDGFVSLRPKSELISLYVNKYGFQTMGQLLYTETQNSEKLIQKYLAQ